MQLVVTCWGHAARVWDADLAGPLLATAGEDGTCRLWDVADGSCAAVIQVGEGYSRGASIRRGSLPLSCSGRLWQLVLPQITAVLRHRYALS